MNELEHLDKELEEKRKLIEQLDLEIKNKMSVLEEMKRIEKEVEMIQNKIAKYLIEDCNEKSIDKQ